MSSAGGGSSTIIAINSSSTQAVETCCRQRPTRRLLRSAVRDRDMLTLRRLLADVTIHDVNAALSDATSCSALSYAVRCGYLDVVEALIDMPGCHVDRVDRTQRSAIDEAIGAWAAAEMDSRGRRQHDCGKRYRIVRRLLASGIHSLSRPALDGVLSSAFGGDSGQQFVHKLVKVICTSTTLYLA